MRKSIMASPLLAGLNDWSHAERLFVSERLLRGLASRPLSRRPQRPRARLSGPRRLREHRRVLPARGPAPPTGESHQGPQPGHRPLSTPEASGAPPSPSPAGTGGSSPHLPHRPPRLRPATWPAKQSRTGQHSPDPRSDRSGPCGGGSKASTAPARNGGSDGSPAGSAARAPAGSPCEAQRPHQSAKERLAGLAESAIHGVMAGSMAARLGDRTLRRSTGGG